VATPKVAIIVSNYNGATNLYNGKPILWLVFHSLQRTKYGNYKAILADDASTDNSIEYTKREFPKVKIIASKLNVGFARINNKGIKYSINSLKADYVLLLNNDIIIKDPDWLRKLVSAARQRGDKVIEGCNLEYPNGASQSINVRIDDKRGTKLEPVQYNDVVYVKEAVFSCILIPSYIIKHVGLLDGNFYMGYEDADYYLRTRKKGFKVLYNGKVHITHLRSHSTHNAKSEEVRKKIFYTGMVNATYFSYKHCGTIQRSLRKLLIICGALFTIEDKNHLKKITSLRLKDKPLLRLHSAIKAIDEGRRKFQDPVYSRHSGG
jgi:hypothetical protein